MLFILIITVFLQVHQLPQCNISDGHCSMLHGTLSLPFVFPVWKWGAKIPQKTQEIYLWATCECFENLLFHQFPVFVISRKCDIMTEKWVYTWRYNTKPWSIEAWTSQGMLLLNNRNPRSFNSRFLFTMIIFVWISSKTQILSCKFCSYFRFF